MEKYELLGEFCTMRTRSTLRHGPVEGYQFGYSPVRFVKPFPVWCYFLHDTLIDTGQQHCRPDILATFSQKTIRQIVLTHFHEDHSGNAAALRRQHNCRVLAGSLTAQRISHAFPLMPYEKFWFGAIDPCPDADLLPAVIEAGLYRLTPILTLGHSDDHHVLHEPSEGWLFAGDFYVGNLKVFRRGENIYQMIEATREILKLDFDTLFCCHNPVLKNGKAAVQRKLSYLETIVEKVLDGQARGMNRQELLKVTGLQEQWLTKFITQNDVSANYLVRSVLEDKE
jgi:glyoxylase-like metal-dependent hydrolase (beta-lactamase superfamily II)